SKTRSVSAWRCSRGAPLSSAAQERGMCRQQAVSALARDTDGSGRAGDIAAVVFQFAQQPVEFFAVALEPSSAPVPQQVRAVDSCNRWFRGGRIGGALSFENRLAVPIDARQESMQVAAAKLFVGCEGERKLGGHLSTIVRGGSSPNAISLSASWVKGAWERSTKPGTCPWGVAWRSSCSARNTAHRSAAAGVSSKKRRLWPACTAIASFR